jgi:hypothetical protein
MKNLAVVAPKYYIDVYFKPLRAELEALGVKLLVFELGTPVLNKSNIFDKEILKTCFSGLFALSQSRVSLATILEILYKTIYSWNSGSFSCGPLVEFLAAATRSYQISKLIPNCSSLIVWNKDYYISSLVMCFCSKIQCIDVEKGWIPGTLRVRSMNHLRPILQTPKIDANILIIGSCYSDIQLWGWSWFINNSYKRSAPKLASYIKSQFPDCNVIYRSHPLCRLSTKIRSRLEKVGVTISDQEELFCDIDNSDICITFGSKAEWDVLSKNKALLKIAPGMISSLPFVSESLMSKHFIGIVQGFLMQVAIGRRILADDINLPPIGEWHVQYAEPGSENSELSSLLYELVILHEISFEANLSDYLSVTC